MLSAQTCAIRPRYEIYLSTDLFHIMDLTKFESTDLCHTAQIEIYLSTDLFHILDLTNFEYTDMCHTDRPDTRFI